MPIEDDDDDGDFKIVASIYEKFRKAHAYFFAFIVISLKYAIMQHTDNIPIVTFSISFRIKNQKIFR